MSEPISFYTTKTIDSWDEVAHRHERTNRSLLNDVKSPTFNNLNPDFNDLVDIVGVADKSVAQVCCNNGVDLLSIKNKGAQRCLGIDGSQAFINQAVTLAAMAGLDDVEFCQCDIYQLPELYRHSFDIVIVTVGVLNWMPDIQKFMQICSSLLTINGQLLIEDMHPVLNMYEQGSPSFINSSYFDTQPYVDDQGLDYFDNEKYEAKENYWFSHSLSSILSSAIACNLALEHIKELPYNISNYCADLESSEHNPPLGINLGWRKQGN